MALVVYFKDDVENAIRGTARAFDAARTAAEEDREQLIARGFHAALESIALCFGVDYVREETK